MLVHPSHVNVDLQGAHSSSGGPLSSTGEASQAWDQVLGGWHPTPPNIKATTGGLFRQGSESPTGSGLPGLVLNPTQGSRPGPRLPPLTSTSGATHSTTTAAQGNLRSVHGGPIQGPGQPLNMGMSLEMMGTNYRTTHHQFVPTTRKRSAAPGSWGGGGLASGLAAAIGNAGAGGTLAAGAAAVQWAQMLGRNMDDESAAWAGALTASSALPGGPGAWGGASSVGDLEALDSILDQLVVLDPRMREALLRGPLVSFETVVPEQRAAALLNDFAEEDLQDRTFLTSVKGVIEEEEEEVAVPTVRYAALPLAHVQAQSTRPQAPVTGLDEDSEMAALRASIPVPILPKLARMYISSKATAAFKAPPQPAPTAAFLLRTRPHHNTLALAPSYDYLVGQIKDVQRQYTCGTDRGKATLAAAEARIPRPSRTTMDMYISGLDGPPLEQVVGNQDPFAMLDRTRPTFVSMHRSAASARQRQRSRSRSPGRRRSTRLGRSPAPHDHPQQHGIDVSSTAPDSSRSPSPTQDHEATPQAAPHHPYHHPSQSMHEHTAQPEGAVLEQSEPNAPADQGQAVIEQEPSLDPAEASSGGATKAAGEAGGGAAEGEAAAGGKAAAVEAEAGAQGAEPVVLSEAQPFEDPSS